MIKRISPIFTHITDAATDDHNVSSSVWRGFLRWRLVLPLLLIVVVAAFFAAVYYANQYWIHRYDTIIERQAQIYRLDPLLVRSLIHQETYFRANKIGEAGEVGLMQITPAVAREWAQETGIQDFEIQVQRDHVEVLRDPERNIQIGCWYLEKLGEKYRDINEPEARVLAAYNAGARRVEEWNKQPPDAAPLTEEEFIKRIDISTTRAYVTEILRRYRYLKSRQ